MGVLLRNSFPAVWSHVKQEQEGILESIAHALPQIPGDYCSSF